jgi:hypothetical protein
MTPSRRRNNAGRILRIRPVQSLPFETDASDNFGSDEVVFID